MDIFTYYIHIFIHNLCFFVVLILINHPFLNADCRFLILSIDHKTNTVLRIIYFNRNYLWTLYRIISKKETMTFSILSFTGSSCPGWIKEGSRYFKVFSTPASSWSDAQTLCQAEGGDVAITNTEPIINKIKGNKNHTLYTVKVKLKKNIICDR